MYTFLLLSLSLSLSLLFQDELRELKQRVAQKIDYGNKFLGLDMIAREENGEVVNPKTSGVMKLFKSVRERDGYNNNVY